MKNPVHLRESDKIILPAIILCLFFGVFGAHRFYLGRYRTAVLQFLTLGGLGIWSLIDLILLATGAFRDADGRKLRKWVTSARETETVQLPQRVDRNLDRLEKRVQNLETIVVDQNRESRWDALSR